MLELIKPSAPIRGTVNLPLSKSIANRFLMLRAIANELNKDQEADAADVAAEHRQADGPPGHRLVREHELVGALAPDGEVHADADDHQQVTGDD